MKNLLDETKGFFAKPLLTAGVIECSHTKVSDIWYTDNLPFITGDSSRFYTGYCEHCEKMVYGRTGRIRIRWNYDRNKTFDDTCR
jgi:hypothetical protein